MNMLRPAIVLRARRRRAAGFSLVELLIAILILGIGIVSIAALLPVGIGQQQRASDDVFGPVVARNALSLLRSRLSPDQFAPDYINLPPAGGTGSGRVIVAGPWFARGYALGDWGWIRPAHVPPGADPRFPQGAIDVFNILERTGTANSLDEADLDGDLNTLFASVIPSQGEILSDIEGVPVTDFPFPREEGGVIGQEERLYPQGADSPDYAWDCMFRRRNGRVLVAIFVYRVFDGLDTATPYSMAVDGNGPTMPHRVNLAPSFTGSWDAIDTFGNTVRSIIETDGAPFDPDNVDDQWQGPRQQLVDQSGNVHSVLLGRRTGFDGPVEFSRPIPEVSGVAASGLGDDTVNGWAGATDNFGAAGWLDTDVVRQIFYVPTRDLQGRRLEPVFVLVEEL